MFNRFIHDERLKFEDDELCMLLIAMVDWNWNFIKHNRVEKNEFKNVWYNFLCISESDIAINQSWSHVFKKLAPMSLYFQIRLLYFILICFSETYLIDYVLFFFHFQKRVHRQILVLYEIRNNKPCDIISQSSPKDFIGITSDWREENIYFEAETLTNIFVILYSLKCNWSELMGK